MSVKRTARSAKFKFQVALDAAKEHQTLSQLASQYELNPGQISQWKRQLLDDGPRLFETAPTGRDEKAAATREADLYEQIGRLKMELAWLEKKAAQ
jgi:transposase-like protein